MKTTHDTGSRAEHVLTRRHKSLVEGIMFFGGMRGKMGDPEWWKALRLINYIALDPLS